VKRHKIGLVRVMSLSGDQVRWLESRLEALFPGIQVVTRCLPDQPYGVHDEDSHRAAEAKLPEAAMSLEAEGARAILVNCAADPGVRAARQRVGAPVIGAGSASALFARTMGLPVGVVTLSGNAPDVVKEALGPLMVGAVPPAGVKTALDLPTPEGREGIMEAGRILKEKGARCLLLACTGMSTLGVARDLREALQLPVVDPLMASMVAAVHLASGEPTLGGALS